MTVELQTHLFTSPKYLIRKKVLKLVGGAFHIFEPDGRLAFYSEQKAFKLKEDIRLFTDETMNTEALIIKARQILDFSAAYDVIDPNTGETIGALKRKGLSSLIKDQWIIMDPSDNEIGSIQEDNMLLALLRRFVVNLIPQSYTGSIHESEVCTFKQNFNPFVTKVTVDFSPDAGNQLDRRLGMAAAILLCAIEGKQR